MAWQVELDRAAVRDLKKLDRPTARRILTFLQSRVAALDDPRSLGEALRGSRLGEFWKYRSAIIGSSPGLRTRRCAFSWCGLAIGGTCIGEGALALPLGLTGPERAAGRRCLGKHRLAGHTTFCQPIGSSPDDIYACP